MKFRSLPISLKLDENATPETIPTEVQIMRTGTFTFEDKGKLEVTQAMLLSMLDNFKSRVRGVDLAIDYKHDSDDVAAGWIQDVYLLNDNQELWAKVKWTPKGRQVLSDKEFRYLSADFHLNFKHNETNKTHGPTLFGAGLTNRPFIKEMEPVITLNEVAKGTQMDEKDTKIAALEAQITELKAQIEKLGAPVDASEEMKKQNTALATQCAELEDKVKAFELSAAEAEKAKQLSEKKAVFDGLMVAGKAVEAQREAFMSGDTLKFAENFVAPNLQGQGSAKDAPVEAKTFEEAQHEIMKLARVKLSDKSAKSMSEAIGMVFKENKELEAKYNKNLG